MIRPIRTPDTGLLLLTGLLLVAGSIPSSLVGQEEPDRVSEDVDCRSDRSDRERYCEEREYNLSARPDLTVDAGQNGGIQVSGWDRDEIRLIARIQASSRNGDPRALARAVEVRTVATIEAAGPRTDRGENWAVSFELMVPREMALRLRASNGGIALHDLTGDIAAHTTNGGITVVGGAGRLQGETTNGGLRLDLTGRTWDGAGVDLRTTNGGVRIRVPDNYSAELEIGTVNGGMQLDIPTTVHGRIDRTIRTRLGAGGPLIRATTTNGGVVVGR